MTSTDHDDTVAKTAAFVDGMITDAERAHAISMRAIDVLVDAAKASEPKPEGAADPQMARCLARVRAACGELKAALIEYGELSGHG